MPFVDLPDEDVSMFYRSNLPGDGSVAFLDRKKDTLLMLPGTILDSTDMDELFDDERLSVRFNMVALDPRSVGRTVNGPSVCRDAWTDAVDYVKALEALQIPAAHIYGVSGGSVAAAKRMAILWPEKCLSLTLVAIQTPETPDWVNEDWAELSTAYLEAQDLEQMEECINNIYPFSLGEYPCEAKVDTVAHYWETQYPPTRATRFYDYAMPLMQRERLLPPVLAMIECPVLLMNGDKVIISSPEEAKAMQEALVNARGGARLHIVEDAPDQFQYLPQFAPEANDHLLDFLTSLPNYHPPPPTGDGMQLALEKLAQIKSDPTIAKRNPRLAASFTCVTPENQEARRQMFERLKEKEKTAFNPVGPDGEPPRKFSERMSAESARDSVRPRSDSSLWAQGIQVFVVENAPAVNPASVVASTS